MSNNICIVPGCDKLREINQGRRICGMHRSRWMRYKSYDIPPKKSLPLDIVKICKKHGPLRQEQTKKRVKGTDWLTCILCLQECEKRFTDKVGHRYRNELKKYYHVGGIIGKKSGLKLSKQEYAELLEKQNNVCAICELPEIAKKKGRDTFMRLAIDHCHITNKIRGLLCLKCNSCLSRSLSFQESEAAIKYLKKHQT